MDINKMLDIQKKIAPELIELFTKRYEMLKVISVYQPIGRRAMAARMGLSERSMRTEIDRLRDMEYISAESSGVELTNSGRVVLEDVERVFYLIKNLSETELKLKEKLNLRRVCVVAGDADNDDFTFNELGRRAAEILGEFIRNDAVIGITGGTTMACAVKYMKKRKGLHGVKVLPARGALNEDLEIEANTIAANLAERLGAGYELLHIPDNLKHEELDALKNNKIIGDVLEDIKKIDLLVFGLGNAFDMAKRRKADVSVFADIERENLTAEAFGYYFNKNGEVKIETNSVGISLDGFRHVKNAIGVAAGSKKAEAIYSLSRFYSDFTLVTDEGAAKKILEM